MKKFSPPEDERGFLPYTPHPFGPRRELLSNADLTDEVHTLHPLSSQKFQALLPSFLYQCMYCKKDNARFLKVPILYSGTNIGF